MRLRSVSVIYGTCITAIVNIACFLIQSLSGLCCYFILAHMSRRLMGELIGYPGSNVHPSSVRRPSVVVRHRPSFTMLKDLLLQNCLANQSQILCGASLGRGNKSLCAASGSHNQDGRHAHMVKTLQKSWEPACRFSGNFVCSIGNSS